jgi:hypothetical protein
MAFAASRSRHHCVTNLRCALRKKGRATCRHIRRRRHQAFILRSSALPCTIRFPDAPPHLRQILTLRLRCPQLFWRVLQENWRAALVIDRGRDLTWDKSGIRPGAASGRGRATARGFAEAGLSNENQEETIYGGDSDGRSNSKLQGLEQHVRAG